jgi:hypothetical protein
MMASVLIAVLIFLSLALFVAVIGVLFWPRQVPKPDAFMTPYGDQPELPFLIAQRGSHEDQRHCSLPDAPSGNTPLAIGRMYADRQRFHSAKSFFRRAL